jgi:hypothetical protein
MIKLILAPLRSIVRFPLLQLAIVIGVILWLQAADDRSIFGQIFNGLDKLVDATVQLFSVVFTVKSFTKSWLISGFMIVYVYLAGSLILYLVRLMIIAAPSAVRTVGHNPMESHPSIAASRIITPSRSDASSPADGASRSPTTDNQAALVKW